MLCSIFLTDGVQKPTVHTSSNPSPCVKNFADSFFLVRLTPYSFLLRGLHCKSCAHVLPNPEFECSHIQNSWLQQRQSSDSLCKPIKQCTMQKIANTSRLLLATNTVRSVISSNLGIAQDNPMKYLAATFLLT